jgi:hypothetical protein
MNEPGHLGESGGVVVQTEGGDPEPVDVTRRGRDVVHIGRNRCKSATGAADSQGHDWTPIYSIFPNDSSELLLYLGLERNNSDDACHPLYRSTTKHNMGGMP